MTTWNTELREIIAATKAMSEKPGAPLFTNTQVILGKRRQCCTLCGFCPEALAERLQAILEAFESGAKNETESP